MRLGRLSSIVAALVFLSVSGLAQDKATGVLKGKVQVEQGSPLGVTVILLQGEQEISRASTDKKGEFAISHVTPGVYSVKFRKPGLTVGTIDSLEIKAGKTRSLSRGVILSVDEGSIAFLRGSVFTESGRSIPGVRVELARIVDETTIQKLDSRVTGETGEFVFRLSPDPAKYRVTVKAEGAQLASRDVEVDSAAVYRVSLTLKPVPK